MRRNRVKRYLPFLAATILLVPLTCCSTAPDPFKDAKPDQKKILVSFTPLFAIAHAVAGDDGYLLCLTTTTGPHEFQGVPTDIFKVNKADLYLYNGLTLDDDFSDKMLRNHSNRNLKVLNVGKVLEERDRRLLKEEKLIIYDPVKHDDHFHPIDPHYWLGTPQAKAMTDIIAAKLAEIDAPNAEKYKSRAAEFSKKLDDLKAYGDAAFKDKKNRKVITMHDSLKYFVKDFGLENIGAIQNQPGNDPDAKRMVDLIEQCKSNNVRVIAVEPQYSKAQAEAIRDAVKRHGIDVQLVTFDPIETAPISGKHGPFNPDPDYYLTKMRENIDNLAKALP
jgi:ABC-type Zn uptake system ZnuABC Zn-binding protein ZnuA